MIQYVTKILTIQPALIQFWQIAQITFNGVQEPEIIRYRDWKKFDNNRFRPDILKFNFTYDDLRTFRETVFSMYNKYAPIKRKVFLRWSTFFDEKTSEVNYEKVNIEEKSFKG